MNTNHHAPVSDERLARSRARLALAVIAAGLAANLAFVMAARMLGADFPYSSFLFLQEDRFADFFKLILTVKEPASQASIIDWPFQPHLEALRQQGIALQGTIINADHLPPLAMALALAARLTIDHFDIVLLYLLVLAALAFAFVWSLRQNRMTRNLTAFWFATLVLSYPLIYAIDRGHVYSLICAVCVISGMLRLVARGRPDMVVLILFAIAINVRPNLIVLPALFFCSRRIGQWRDMALLLAIAALLFAAGLLVSNAINPDYTLQSWSKGLEDIRIFRILAPHVQGLQSSLATIPELLGMARHESQVLSFCIAEIIGVAALVLAWKGRLTTVEMAILALAAMPIGLPDFADYHLLPFLLVPMLYAKLESTPTRGERIAFAASLFVLVPKAYIFGAPWSLAPWSSQTILNPLALLIACFAILAVAVKRPAADRVEPGAQPA
jgi:hypothetical protein